MDIAAGLERAASEHGQRIALRCGSAALTYAELAEASRRLAGALLRRHLVAGDALAVLCENNLELLQLYYAAARLGLLFVPLNQSLSAREVAYVMAHSGAGLLLHDAALGKVAEAAAAPEVRMLLSDFFSDLPAPRSAPPLLDRADEDFLIIYTSGSTGAPKAVVFDQRGEIAGNRSLAELWGIGPADVTLVALPLGFLYGLSTAAATGLQAGGEVVVLRRFNPGEVLSQLIESKATVYHGVPTMFSMMLDYANQQRLDVDLSHLRLLIAAGAPLSEELREGFEARFGKRIDNYYALTEARPIFGRRWNDHEPLPHGAVGRVAPGVRVRIRGERGQSQPAGKHGEILVHAPATLRRYHKDASLTRQVLRDGWFATGDLGYCDAAGNFFLTGRIKDLIIHGGANVAPAEVEEILNGHPAVAMAAVVGVPDATFGEIPIAYLVARNEVRVTEEELREFCTVRLAQYKVPTAFVFVPSLPLGLTGKVDKKALKQMWMEQH